MICLEYLLFWLWIICRGKISSEYDVILVNEVTTSVKQKENWTVPPKIILQESQLRAKSDKRFGRNFTFNDLPKDLRKNFWLARRISVGRIIDISPNIRISRIFVPFSIDQVLTLQEWKKAVSLLLQNTCTTCTLHMIIFRDSQIGIWLISTICGQNALGHVTQWQDQL